jgi:hypothetical protein
MYFQLITINPFPRFGSSDFRIGPLRRSLARREVVISEIPLNYVFRVPLQESDVRFRLGIAPAAVQAVAPSRRLAGCAPGVS